MRLTYMCDLCADNEAHGSTECGTFICESCIDSGEGIVEEHASNGEVYYYLEEDQGGAQGGDSSEWARVAAYLLQWDVVVAIASGCPMCMCAQTQGFTCAYAQRFIEQVFI